jgi:hypothetical protein
MNSLSIVIKNPSKKVLDLMAQIASDKEAKRAELRAQWEKEHVKEAVTAK